MLTSVRWLNALLDPPTLTPHEAEERLTAHSFPIESTSAAPGGEGDTVLDVEVTSNRGDCLCHLGLARELAASTGRRLKTPNPNPKSPAGAQKADAITSVLNHATEVCPRFTARVIKGVKVGPSPAWLVKALEAVGQRSINNVVDVSNYVLFELGHPSHTFDLNTLEGKRLIVRYAHEGEAFTALDKRAHTLKATDLVVADARRAVSLAGVIGGLETGVTDKTTDVLLELATWDPATIRRAARRMGIRTDASHRFERIVAAGDLPWASARCAELILQVAGGELCEGLIDTADAPAPRVVVPLRPQRITHILGKEIDPAEVQRLLDIIGIEVSSSGGAGFQPAILTCTIPHHRPDLTREIDLIEEIARLHGLDNFALAEFIPVSLSINQPQSWDLREKAVDALARTLTGLGYFETVTFSFVPREHAEMFVPKGLRTLKVDEARRPGTPYLRPSIAPSLLTCRRANQDAKVNPDRADAQIGTGVRLFELASVFAEEDDANAHARKTRQQRHLGLLIDAGNDHDNNQRALRAVRGTIEHAVRALGGPAPTVQFAPMPAPFKGADPATCAAVTINGKPAGYFALASAEAMKHWGLDEKVCLAEVCLTTLTDLYPPKSRVKPMPEFPGIERDLSIVVDETTAWARLENIVESAKLDRLESLRYVGVYRDPKKLAPGKKSVTLRLAFRDPSRTLRREEVDPQMAAAMSALKDAVGAELRV
ncbi:MAG: phenylalanine--tRNA ligase subunit beta [Phycisphaerales bacterium]